MKFAAVDIGTNSFHLIIIEVNEQGYFNIIDREKEVIRLGEGNKGDIKYILDPSLERAVDTLKRFKGLADSHDAKLYALATSAVRESVNRNYFVSEVKRRTGIQIRIISGLEEARLIHIGISKAIDIYDSKTLSIDIGGGSTEFIVSYKGNILYSNSLKLGAFRLTNKFFKNQDYSKSNIKECISWVKGVLVPVARDINKLGIEKVVGSSGTITSVASMIYFGNNPNKEDINFNNFEYSLDELEDVTKKVFQVKKKKKIPGLDPKRADIISAGLILLSEIFAQFRFEKLIVSDYALREGIIYDKLAKRGIISADSFQADVRMDSIRKLASTFFFPKVHCEHVGNLSRQFFNETRSLHQLPDYTSDYLYAASLLHDIGFHISHSQHHKHSYYLIRNSELLGYTDSEINIIAHIARYHRKSHPKTSHELFQKLNLEDKIIIRKLAAILRITDSFDRTHSNNIKDFKVQMSDNDVKIILTNSETNIENELWSFERRKHLFEEVFNIKVSVKVQS